MSQNLYIPAEQHDFGGCPIPATHRRLRHAHTIWHQALENYHNPDKFHANLNAAIEALRNITFALQKEKAAFRDFDEWYGPWQKKLQDDRTSKWLNEARVTVVHKGDLDSYSFAEVRLITWREEVLSAIKIPIQTPSRLILQNPALLDMLDPSGKDAWKLGDAALLIERRWSTKELQGREILSALAHVYGLLADLVLDAHSFLGHMSCIRTDDPHQDFPSPYDRTGLPRCMIASTEARTERFKPSTQERIFPLVDLVPTVDPKIAICRYGFEDGFQISEMQNLDPLALAEKFLYRAKRILRRDKRHSWMMFLRDGRGQWHHLILSAEDRTERHVLMQLIAQFVETRGCDAVIEIGEVWTARVSADLPPIAQDVERIPGREEGLSLMVATREGLLRWYITPIERGRFGGIKLGTTTQVDNERLFYFEPIIDVWRKQREFRAQDGSKSQVWEPDALDLCPCGGLNRYGECCRSRVAKGTDAKSARAEVENAIAIGDLNRAEEIARASLAQYVIWTKQHTAAAMQGGDAGREFYEKIVQLDALALESLINVMVRALSVADKKDLILPQLRRLRELVCVPRLAMRLTAIASRWLFESERPEEAVLELDALGPVSELEDSLALSLLARYTDLAGDEKKELLKKATEVAACDGEKHFAQLSLASYLSDDGESSEALSLVRLVLKETEGDQSSAERSAALILLWKISRLEDDFRTGFHEMEKDDEEEHRYRNSIYLIDGGKYTEAEHLLASLVRTGQVKAKLLITDARIRSGALESAGELFSTIQLDEVSSNLRFAYAVTISLLVLAAGFIQLRGRAISSLSSLPPAGGEQDSEVKSLLQSLKST